LIFSFFCTCPSFGGSSLSASGGRKVLINYYSKESERGILYNDPDLKIDWILPEQNLLISDKDEANSPLKEASVLFNN
jgi:hypothetical protein